MTMQQSPIEHKPVLLNEALEALNVQPGGRYIDCTLGAGGHSAAIMERSAPGGQLLGMDADPSALTVAREKLKKYHDSVLIVNENFTNLQATCIKYDFFPVHGILMDLGLSSLQLSRFGRGFSFQEDAPLDMRFSPEQKITAADIVNTATEERLAHIIKIYGEEPHARRIAHQIVAARPLSTTLQLAKVVEQATGRHGKIHPATRTFQALRIAVNHELENLESALRQAVELLGYEGRLVVITYHSLEDRIVKQFMQQEAKSCICPVGTPICVCGHTARLRLVNKKVITPGSEELSDNPRSRSAKLRCAERLVSTGNSYAASDDHAFLSIARSRGWRRPALLHKIRTAFLAA